MKNLIFLILLLLTFHQSIPSKNFLKQDKIFTVKLSKTQTNSITSLIEVSKNKQKKLTIASLNKKMTEYSGTITVGNPAQEFEVVFDTGSANTIIPSSRCNTETCMNHRRYDAKKSSTSKVIKYLPNTNIETKTKINKRDHRQEILIYFGTGAVKCELVSDVMCVQNLCANETVILEAIHETKNPFSHVKFDGIVGLSFSHLSLTKESNFMDRLIHSKKIKRNIFSFYFNKNDTDHSEISFGGVNRNKILSEISYQNVIGKDYWEIKIMNVFYGNIKFNICERFSCSGIVDTGTSMIAGPIEFIEMISQLADPKLDCSNYANLKNFIFEIGGIFFELDPEYYVLRVNQEVFKNEMGYLDTPQNSFYKDIPLKCVAAFMPMSSFSDDDRMNFLLGTPFIKKYYTVFDRENKRVGFALAKH